MDKKLEKQRVLKIIRETMLLFGQPTEHLTDEELEEGIINFTKTIANTGYSSKEFGESMKKAMRTLKG